MIQQSTLFPGLHATKNESNLAVFDAFLAQLKSPLQMWWQMFMSPMSTVTRWFMIG